MNESHAGPEGRKKSLLGLDLRSILPARSEPWTRWALYAAVGACQIALVRNRDVPWKTTSDWFPYAIFGLCFLTMFYTYVVVRVDRFSGWSVYACGFAIGQFQMLDVDTNSRLATRFGITALLLIFVAIAHDAEYARRRALEEERDRKAADGAGASAAPSTGP